MRHGTLLPREQGDSDDVTPRGRGSSLWTEEAIGRDRVGRLLAGLVVKRYEPLTSREVTVGGAPGLWLTRPDGAPHSLVALGFTSDGERVAAIYTIRNPDELRAVLNADRRARTTP